MKHKTSLFSIIIILLLTLGCTDKQEGSSTSSTTITATANGVRHANGTISIKSDADIPPEMNKQFEKRFEINRQYPADHPSKDTQLFTAKEILSGDTIILNDGTHFKLAGIIAPNKSSTIFNEAIEEKYQVGINKISKYELLSREYLQRLLNDEKLACIPQSKAENETIMGYLWIVDDSLMNDPETKAFIKSPSYSCINETVITSGWCFADMAFSHKFLEKYLILQEHAKAAKVGLWEQGF
jgi:endonuclease YncB( thermonuclease family)